jgi:colanic acid/amylovoran biosynthesis glycosyltransferase
VKLGYLIPEFPGQTHIFFWREIQALRRIGEEVALLSTRKPPNACRHDFVSSAVAETRYLFPPALPNLARWISSGGKGLSRAMSYLHLLETSGPKTRIRHLALLAAAVDLVQWAKRESVEHIHGHSCADAAHVLALARCAGGPSYSITLHGDLEVYGTDHVQKLKDAAFVCAVGSHLRQQLVERAGVPGQRIIVTCMGVETSKLATLGWDRPYTPGSLHIVTVARLHPAKGHLHALRAIHRGVGAGADLRYTIAGDGPHRDALLTQIDELGLRDRVKLPGTLSESEVFALLSKADAFVLPSIGVGEAWPVSVMEAMAAGLPVIASAIGATPEMITTGQDGFLIPQRDEGSLFESMMRLAMDVELRRSIGQAARQKARQRFDVAATARTLSDAVRASLELRKHTPLNQSLTDAIKA